MAGVGATTEASHQAPLTLTDMRAQMGKQSDGRLVAPGECYLT